MLSIYFVNSVLFHKIRNYRVNLDQTPVNKVNNDGIAIGIWETKLTHSVLREICISNRMILFTRDSEIIKTAVSETKSIAAANRKCDPVDNYHVKTSRIEISRVLISYNICLVTKKT